MENTTVRMAFIALAGIASSAASADDDRWYATATLGFGNLASTTLDFSDGTDTASADASFETSFAGGGTLGYRFDNGWNLEGEIQYRRNELEPVTLAGLGNFDEGDYASLAFGLNALYRFKLGDSGKWSSYAGPGVVWFQEIDIDFDSGGNQEISFESDDTALQFKLGTRYDVSDRLFLDATASYLTAGGITMELPSDASQTIASDYDHVTFALGIGYRF